MAPVSALRFVVMLRLGVVGSGQRSRRSAHTLATTKIEASGKNIRSFARSAQRWEMVIDHIARSIVTHSTTQEAMVKLVYRLVDNMLDQFLDQWKVDHADLNKTILGKGVHITTVLFMSADGIRYCRLRPWQRRTHVKCVRDSFNGKLKALYDSASPYEFGRSLPDSFGLMEEAEHWAGRFNGALPPAAKVVFPEAPPFVILPGFGHAAIDYIAPLQQPEEIGMVAALRRRGITSVEVVPINRSSWLNVFRGVLDLNFWMGDTRPDGPAYNWYLRIARETIEKVVASRRDDLGTSTSQRSVDSRVMLIGHSAGGWLARALCLDETWARKHVRGIVTLGTPHLAGEGLDRFLGFFVAEGQLLLGFVAAGNLNRRSPGAFLKEQFFYVSVASNRARGNATSQQGSVAQSIFNSYLDTCGNGSVAGDGDVPLMSAHLNGSTQITLNCWHTVAEPWTSRPTDNWYGAEPVIDEWLGVVAQKLRIADSSSESQV